jgi:hypothetical protein
MFLLLFGCLWLVDLRFIPGTYERIFQSPISSIQRVQIYPRTNLPLINQNVTVIDSVPIQKIMIAIRSARPYSPNHPADRWTCELIISNSSGESYIRIADTLGEGTILYCAGGPFRSDTLGDILEKVVAKK